MPRWFYWQSAGALAAPLVGAFFNVQPRSFGAMIVASVCIGCLLGVCVCGIRNLHRGMG